MGQAVCKVMRLLSPQVCKQRQGSLRRRVLHGAGGLGQCLQTALVTLKPGVPLSILASAFFFSPGRQVKPPTKLYMFWFLLKT